MNKNIKSNVKDKSNMKNNFNINPDGLIVLDQPKFSVAIIDPPWPTCQRGNKGAIQHYNLMSLDQIKAMPISDFMKDSAACFLWATNAVLPEALEVLKAWGFTYRGYYIWGKAQMGLGQYFRNATEIMLLGTKGKMLPDCKNQMNWNLLPRQQHSAKPKEYVAMIERMYKNRSYLELFCRERPSNPHWYCWGNECEGGSDIYIPGYPVPEYSDRVHFAKPDDLEEGA